MDNIYNSSILVTGGTGTFGKAFTKHILENYDIKKIVILSRSEYNQWLMKDNFQKYDNKIRYVIADIKDQSRLDIAFQNIDYVVHTAALKQIDTVEYNPHEAVSVNINGSINVINSAIKNNVKKCILLNTDKSCAPINFYGATKMLAEKLFLLSSIYSPHYNIKLSSVRYGNIINSRGSVIELYKKLKSNGAKKLPLTNTEMSRFWTDINDAINMVIEALKYSVGNDVFIPKCKSFFIEDLIKAFGCEPEIIKERPNEKLSEQLIMPHEITIEHDRYYKIYSELHNNYHEKITEYGLNIGNQGKRLKGFSLISGNDKIISIDEIKKELKLL